MLDRRSQLVQLYGALLELPFVATCLAAAEDALGVVPLQVCGLRTEEALAETGYGRVVLQGEAIM